MGGGTPIVTPVGNGPPPLSGKTIEGKDPPVVEQGPPKLRLFVSAVGPLKLLMHCGVFVDPFVPEIRTVIAEPMLKNASEAQQSPTMLNSAPVHPCASPRMLS
jgi:hypothetical protein